MQSRGQDAYVVVSRNDFGKPSEYRSGVSAAALIRSRGDRLHVTRTQGEAVANHDSRDKGGVTDDAALVPDYSTETPKRVRPILGREVAAIRGGQPFTQLTLGRCARTVR